MSRSRDAAAREPMVVSDLGCAPYVEAWELQKRHVAQRHAGEHGDIVLVCEHEPIVTTGRGTREDFLRDSRFEVIEVERGGEATYHGPGQIVVYPIVKLAESRRDLHAWMRALEQAVIDVLGTFGLVTGRRAGATGVWVDGARKVCSIGVAASRWITYHGLALNLDPDLEHFDAIRPCGFDAQVMTSLARELGARAPDRAALVDGLVERLHEELEPFREPPLPREADA